MRRAFESEDMKNHHLSCADGIKRQLDVSVFSDDPDAVDALKSRIAEREAEAGRIKAYNASCRAAAKRGELHGDLSLLDDRQKADIANILRVCAYQVGPGGSFPSYATTNLRANIRRDQQRLEDIQRRAKRAEQAANAPNGVLITGEDYINVTFAEKPGREIIDALKAAGFGWGGGTWGGYRDKLPDIVSELVVKTLNMSAITTKQATSGSERTEPACECCGGLVEGDAPVFEDAKVCINCCAAINEGRITRP
jgi:hypothetical protein